MHSEADDTSGLTAGSAYDMVQPATFVRALAARRAHARATDRLAVLVIRLDRFASACETLGPQRSARLRKQVEARIASLLPPEAGIHWLALADLAVATALPDEVTDPDRLGTRIADDLARPFSLDGFELFLSCSIGVVLDHPDIAAERSLQHAVDAMVRVYRQGGDGLANGSAPGTPATAPLLAALPHALKRGELSLQLQPRADFGSANVSGYTVRLRWQHPSLGRVAPQDFLPAMESLDLMGTIGAWLLQSILPVMKAADAIGPVQFTLLAASAQLHRMQMIEALNSAIDAAGIAPERLCIEVPVSAVPADEALFAQFQPLRQRGVQLALSDFNGAETSMQTLQRVRPDIVTLDARHLGHADQPPDTPERLRTACALARNTGAMVCAKGIETRQQLEAVRDWGCHSLQGYLLAQPFPATWLVQTHWAIQQRARQLLMPAK